jgi:hypothetical protein
VANPVRSLRDTFAGTEQSVADFILDIQAVNDVLDLLGIKAEDAEENIESLTGTIVGGAIDLTPGLAAIEAATGEEIVTGERAGDGSTDVGTASGQEDGTVGGIGATFDASSSTDTSGQETQSDPVLPNQPNTPTVVNNNDITVNGASDPAQTRESVRRAVEEANRQQRNAEDGRVD